MIDVVYDTSKRYHAMLCVDDGKLNIDLNILEPGDNKRSNIC